MTAIAIDAIAGPAASLLPLANEHWDHPWPWILLFPIYWGLIILGIFWLARRFGPRGRTGQFRRPETGIEILERRFAAGEIDHDEFRQRRSTLEGDHRD
jgi:putative membrane protein